MARSCVNPLPRGGALVTLTLALPKLDSVTCCVMGSDPTGILPKSMIVGFREARGVGGSAPKIEMGLPLPGGLLVISTEVPAEPPPHPAVSRLSERRIAQSPRAA